MPTPKQEPQISLPKTINYDWLKYSKVNGLYGDHLKFAIKNKLIDKRFTHQIFKFQSTSQNEVFDLWLKERSSTKKRIFEDVNYITPPPPKKRKLNGEKARQRYLLANEKEIINNLLTNTHFKS